KPRPASTRDASLRRVIHVATWNVNGVRARETQILEWLRRDDPSVVCLQELKAPLAKVPASLCALDSYWCRWHGVSAYSGVALQLRRDKFAAEPAYSHPSFDFETRIVTARIGRVGV